MQAEKVCCSYHTDFRNNLGRGALGNVLFVSRQYPFLYSLMNRANEFLWLLITSSVHWPPFLSTLQEPKPVIMRSHNLFNFFICNGKYCYQPSTVGRKIVAEQTQYENDCKSATCFLILVERCSKAEKYSPTTSHNPNTQ